MWNWFDIDVGTSFFSILRINKSVSTSQSHICDIQYIFKRNAIYFLWEKLHLHGVSLAVKVIVSEAKYK